MLKKGHRTIDRARNSLLCTSNVLSNILIVSDFAGVSTIDMIADTLVRLIEGSSQLDPFRRLQSHQVGESYSIIL